MAGLQCRTSRQAQARASGGPVQRFTGPPSHRAGRVGVHCRQRLPLRHAAWPSGTRQSRPCSTSRCCIAMSGAPRRCRTHLSSSTTNPASSSSFRRGGRPRWYCVPSAPRPSGNKTHRDVEVGELAHARVHKRLHLRIRAELSAAHLQNGLGKLRALDRHCGRLTGAAQRQHNKPFSSAASAMQHALQSDSSTLSENSASFLQALHSNAPENPALRQYSADSSPCPTDASACACIKTNPMRRYHCGAQQPRGRQSMLPHAPLGQQRSAVVAQDMIIPGTERAVPLCAHVHVPRTRRAASWSSMRRILGRTAIFFYQ